MDGEFESQNGLQGVDVEDPAHEKEGNMATRGDQGPQGKRIVADVRTTNKLFL